MIRLLAPDGPPLAVHPVDAEVAADRVTWTVELDGAGWQRVLDQQLFHLDAAHAPSLDERLPGSGVYRLLLRLGAGGSDVAREQLLTQPPDELADTEAWYAEDVQREIVLPDELQAPGARLAAGAPTGWRTRPPSDAPLLTRVRTWFAEQGMAATAVEDSTVLRLEGDGLNGAWVLWVETREDDGLVLVWSSWPEAVPEGRRRPVMELVTRLNTDLAVGAYELDLDRGQVSFRTSLDVTGGELTGALLSRLVGANIEAFDDHLPVLLDVVAGQEPQVALARHSA